MFLLCLVALVWKVEALFTKIRFITYMTKGLGRVFYWKQTKRKQRSAGVPHFFQFLSFAYKLFLLSCIFSVDYWIFSTLHLIVSEFIYLWPDLYLFYFRPLLTFSFDLMLNMQFDITFPALQCSIISLDAMDISGLEHLDVVCISVMLLATIVSWYVSFGHYELYLITDCWYLQ